MCDLLAVTPFTHGAPYMTVAFGTDTLQPTLAALPFRLRLHQLHNGVAL